MQEVYRGLFYRREYIKKKKQNAFYAIIKVQQNKEVFLYDAEK